ncbi:hypothetical protein BGZ46_005241 [Entomortierella lignicola]|nr:hypothetical protein BGZ46_005241 [Entomortierella lignicola]
MVKLKSLVGRGVLALSVLIMTVAAQTTSKAVATTTASALSKTATGTATPTTNFIFSTVPVGTSTATSPKPTSSSSGSSGLSACPGPLISNTMNLNISTCIGPCCIKCPAVESFYEPNEIQRVLKGAYITRQFSLGFSVFMVISYLVLPGKRSQPHISVLFLTVSTSLWYASFDLMPGVSNACINDFEESTAQNSRLCGFQGVLIIYLTQTSALWCSLLIYKLHLLAVWRSNWIDNHYGWFTAICWLLPMGFAIPVAVKGLSQYPGIGFSCLVSPDNLNKYLFYPTAVYMYPAMFCHIATVGKMIHLAVLSSRIETGLSQLSSDARMRITTTMQAKRLLRGQWRPALMVGVVMSLLTVFWLFYFIDAHRLATITPKTEWLQQWVTCVFLNGAAGKSSFETQTICAKGSRPNLPSVPWFTAAESLLAIIGIVIAVIFITKIDFWEDWAFLLNNLFRRGKTGSGSSRGRSSPDDDESSAHGDSKPENRMNTAMNRNPPVVFKNINTSKAQLNETPSTQWYDMDDLLDKEYDDQGNRVPQRALSGGSSRNVVTYSGPISEPPRYNSDDIFYKTPLEEAKPAHWSPSSATSKRLYTEQPVVPSPVPRTPKMSSREPVYLSNSPPTSSSIPLPPTALTNSGSLTPMPPKSPTKQQQKQQWSGSIDSAPIISVATRGSVTQAYQKPSQSSPSSPASQKQRLNAYDSYESADQALAPHHGTRGGSAISSPNTSMRINTAIANSGASTDPRTMSPPAPSVPNKSPRRQNHPAYASPPIRLPSSS